VLLRFVRVVLTRVSRARATVARGVSLVAGQASVGCEVTRDVDDQVDGSRCTVEQGNSSVQAERHYLVTGGSGKVKFVMGCCVPLGKAVRYPLAPALVMVRSTATPYAGRDCGSASD
jgi:hypothetical protein